MLKLEIIVNPAQLLCIVVSATPASEYERFGGFLYYYTLKGDKGEKLLFERYRAKPILTQK